MSFKFSQVLIRYLWKALVLNLFILYKICFTYYLLIAFVFLSFVILLYITNENLERKKTYKEDKESVNSLLKRLKSLINVFDLCFKFFITYVYKGLVTQKIYYF